MRCRLAGWLILHEAECDGMEFQAGQRNLLQCDSRQSVLSRGAGARLAYCCFGWSGNGEFRLAFNGVLLERAGGYLLGNGYRMYSPMLGRFYNPDKLSPFGEGGINAFVYCRGDPVNFHDFSGLAPNPFFKLLKQYKPAPLGSASNLFQERVLARRGSTGTVVEAVSPKSRPVIAIKQSDDWKGKRTQLLSYENESTSFLSESVQRKRRELYMQTKGELEQDFSGYDLRSGIDKRLQGHPGVGAAFDFPVGNDEFARRVLGQELIPRSMPSGSTLVRSASMPAQASRRLRGA